MINSGNMIPSTGFDSNDISLIDIKNRDIWGFKNSSKNASCILSKVEVWFIWYAFIKTFETQGIMNNWILEQLCDQKRPKKMS